MKWGLTFEIHQEALVSGGIREQDGCCVSARWLGLEVILGGMVKSALADPSTSLVIHASSFS